MTDFWRAHEERLQPQAAMDYFDFEEAAQTFPDFDLDDCSSTVPQMNEGEAQDNY